MDDHETIREALFERFSSSTTWYCLSQKYGVSVMKLRRAYASWMKNPTESQPLSQRDVHFTLRSPGRPFMFPHRHEMKIAEAVKYYADNNTPLSRPGVRDLIRSYVDLLCEEERKEVSIGENGPSTTCLNNMMDRFGLKDMSAQVVEDERLNAITPKIVSEHVARIQAAINRFRIRDPKYIFNVDQSGSSFKRMVGRSLRKGYGTKDVKLQQACIKTKGQLDRVTLMPCVSAAGKAYKPVFVFPGVQPHYRKVRGIYQGLHCVLPDCYLHYREIPGADSDIVYNWAVNFVQETNELREDGQYLLLLLDGYSAHVQFRTLALLRRNRIIVIALPAHSSHRLQPLDVSVFAPYKSYLQSLIHQAARVRKKLNAFDIATILTNAYSRSMTVPNIRSGFIACGVWNDELLGTDISALQHLFTDTSMEKTRSPSLNELLIHFQKKNRSLLRDADVEEDGTIKINTKRGAHLTSEAVLSALKKREQKKLDKLKTATRRQSKDDRAFREPAADIRHYAEEAERRSKQRKRLIISRDDRIVRQKLRLGCDDHLQ